MDFDTSKQTVGWIKDRYLEGTLELRPPFQRKPVWAGKQKAYLIESVLMGVPIPEIYIQQITSADGTTTYAVVDGQQRIRALLQFIGADRDESEQEFNKFPLDKLPGSAKWYGKTLAALDERDRIQFYGYSLAVRTLNTDSDVLVRDVFQRLNTNLMPLKPQELRNAIFGGPFARLATALADETYWAENAIVSPALIRRMGDIEFCAQLLIGVIHGPQGGDSASIDEYYTQYEDYDDEFPGERQASVSFAATLSEVRDLLPDLKATRWRNKTDFYSLFVATCAILRETQLQHLSGAARTRLRKKLKEFAGEIDSTTDADQRRADDPVSRYIKAVEKGANDKSRRAARHSVLLGLMRPLVGAGSVS